MPLDSFSSHRQDAGIKIDPAHVAVIVVDMINDFCKPGGAMVLPGYEALVGPQLSVIEAARAAGAPVEGMVGEEDPFEAVSSALRDRGFDEVIISTLPKRVSEWLRRDLPHRIERLGVLVTTVSQSEEREAPAAPAGVRM